MCGIVGLFAKTPEFEAALGRHLAHMLGVLSDRGPDSAGFAVYRNAVQGRSKITVRSSKLKSIGADIDALSQAFDGNLSSEIRGSHAILGLPAGRENDLRTAIRALGLPFEFVGSGMRMELYKDVGLPSEVARKFDLSQMKGTHGIGHTRMATESAVTIAGAHPFSTGPDQCLVHNGSLSNHNDLRRKLKYEGFDFETENDTEVAATYLTWKMHNGITLGEALEHSLDDIDGFYTFVVGTEDGFGVLRDRIACKPAVLAETDDYVAFASEYRALADLPGVGAAKVWEPEPATVYFWERRT